MVSPTARLHRVDHATQPPAAPLPRPLQQFAFDADVSEDQIMSVAVGWGLAMSAAIAVGVFGGIGHMLAALAVAVLVPSTLVVRLSGRRTRRMVASLPDLIDMLGRSLRSGASLGQALREACAEAPPVVAHELRAIVAELDLGQTSHHALRSWADRTPAIEVRIVAAALAVASENEAGTSLALAGVSQSLRDRRALVAEIRSHTAQASASMRAMVWLPIGLLMVDALGDQSRLRYLTREPLGRACLGAAAVLTLVGWVWMQAIIRRQLPS